MVACQRRIAGHRAGVIVISGLHIVGGTLEVGAAPLSEDVLLRELASAETEVGIEVPVLIGERCADAGVGECASALEGSEIAVIIGDVSHHARSHGEAEIIFLEFDRRLVVEVLGCCCQAECQCRQ